jgi:hypothetical protein
LAIQNRDFLKVFGRKAKTNEQYIPLNHNEVKAKYSFSDGQQRLEEFYWGSGYLSQKGRFVIKSKTVVKIELMDSKGVVQRILQ